jgi:hypothetical protein
MTLLQKINKLNFFDFLAKIKSILLDLMALISTQEPKYKIYRALLTQEGSNNPVAVVLENTLGVEVNWVRNDTGDYSLVAEEDIFFQEKLFLQRIGSNTTISSTIPNGVSFNYIDQYRESDTVVSLQAITGDNLTDWVQSDDILGTNELPYSFELIIYN